MVSAPSHARVTLALDIVRKLEDGPHAGYHELRVIKHEIELADEITLELANNISIDCDHPQVPRDQHNLCWKAVEVFQQAFDINRGVQVSIAKQIPVEGGLAGGSTNAATVLRLLPELWGVEVSTEQLVELGRTVGMDVPFYLHGGTALDAEATGLFEPLETNIVFDFVVVLPEFGVATHSAYRGINYDGIARNVAMTEAMQAAFLQNNSAGIAKNMHNDFELHVFRDYPELAEVKAMLLEAGCEAVVLSGSGSAVVGLLGDSELGLQLAKSLPYHTILTRSRCKE